MKHIYLLLRIFPYFNWETIDKQINQQTLEVILVQTNRVKFV